MNGGGENEGANSAKAVAPASTLERPTTEVSPRVESGLRPEGHRQTVALMPHFVALLRGINLGNRRIKMDALRGLFEQLKFTDVTTFIASGNVLFTAKLTDERKLTAQIESHLKKSLGYEVDTFLRTRAEIAAVAESAPFARPELENPVNTIHAGFLREALSPEQARLLLARRTDVDEFCVEGREFYWLCRIKSHESKAWNSAAMKALKLPTATMRNLTTVRKLATLFPAN